MKQTITYLMKNSKADNLVKGIKTLGSKNVFSSFISNSIIKWFQNPLNILIDIDISVNENKNGAD